MRDCQSIMNELYRNNRDERDERRGKHNHRENECRHAHDRDCPQALRHTHEYLGSVKIAEIQEDPHNHRFAGVTGQAILLSNGNHFHKLEDNTDFYEDHFHVVEAKTGPAIPVGNERHVHFIESQTTFVDGHRHELQFATLINDPIGE